MGTAVGSEADAFSLGELFFVEYIVLGDGDVVVGITQSRADYICKSQANHNGSYVNGIAYFRTLVPDEPPLEVVVSAGVFVDEAVDLLHVVHLEALLIAASGDVDQYVLGGLEVEVVEQWALEGLFDGLLDTVRSGARAAAH